jgi:hypothetical protein
MLRLRSLSRGKGGERKDDGAMSLISRLLQAASSWRRRRGGYKTIKRAVTTVEQLDHRQLLAVNFTGNVPIDFPATQTPGVVILPDNPSVVHPVISPLVAPFVKVSGFDINQIRVSYSAADDTLSIGLASPPSGNPGQGQVIAGDADDNGNQGTVNPSLQAAVPSFEDFPNFGGSEYMGAFLNFTGSGTPQIVAGFSQVAPPPTPTDPAPPKHYEVAEATPILPTFGAELPQFEGGSFLPIAPNGPNLEFSIAHFSQLYQQETGKKLTPGTTIYVGGMGGSANDTGIGEAFFPAAPVLISAASVPPPMTCSPPIFVNPHEHRIIDTHHRDLVRVTIVGSSGFDVREINPSTVTLNGVHAIAHITRKIRRNEFPFATYVFVANQLSLPPGLQTVTLAGALQNGMTFQSSKTVLNIPDAARVQGPLFRYMGGGSIYRSLTRLEAKHPGTVAIPAARPTAVSISANPAPSGLARIKVNYSPVVAGSKAAGKAARVDTPRAVIKIQRRDAAAGEASKVPTRLRHSMAEFLSQTGSGARAAGSGSASAV